MWPSYSRSMETKNHARCPYMNFLNRHREEGEQLGDVDVAILGASLGG